MNAKQKKNLQEALQQVNEKLDNEKLDKAYRSGKLSSDWLSKVPNKTTEE